MRVVALTAHGFCGLRQAEALVLDWFESEGLELVLARSGVLIGWSEISGSADACLPCLAVEVRFYELSGGWLQVRWSLQWGDAQAPQGWADGLIASLRSRLQDETLWQIDGP